MNNEAVSLGTLARPGVTRSLDINICAPSWLPPGGVLPCWEADPETFFPLRYNLTCKDQIEEAQSICASCPVKTLCLEWALERPDLQGIWATTTPMDRRRIRTGKQPRPDWAQRRDEVA